MSVTRDDFDEDGTRYAECERCGMSWLEHRESVDLFGVGRTQDMTIVGERDHECPEPFPYEIARQLANSGPIVVSQRFKARVKLGLEAGPTP